MIKIFNYKVLNTKKINKKIVSISDLHYYQKKDLKKLYKILDKIKDINPDYIVISGDFVDQSEVLEEDLFINYLKDMSKICKVIIGVGNHDVAELTNHTYKRNEGLFNKIRKIKNLVFLDNEEYIEDDIRFIGVTLPFTYYKPLNEEGKYLVDYLNKNQKSFDKKYYNLLICHSPIITLKYYDEINFLKNIDLTLYGHMHGGLMPNMLKSISNGRGLVSPRFKMLPKYSHGYLEDKKSIVNSGVTKLSHANKKIIRMLDIFYSSEIAVIDLISK